MVQTFLNTILLLIKSYTDYHITFNQRSNIMKKLVLIFILLLATTSFYSCGKKGCTGKYANNFCEECKDDDGSCVYNGTVRFWVSNATTDNLFAEGWSTISIRVDGILAGTLTISDFGISPVYGEELTYTKDLGNNSSKAISCSFSLDKYSEIGFETITKEVTFDASKSLNSFEFVY